MEVGWHRELHFMPFFTQQQRPVLHPVLHWHFWNPWPPPDLATITRRGSSVSSGTSSIASIFSFTLSRSARVKDPASNPSFVPTLYKSQFSDIITTKIFFGHAGPRSNSGTLRYRTTGVRILPGPGPGETKIAGAGAGAGGRKLSRILLIYNH